MENDDIDEAAQRAELAERVSKALLRVYRNDVGRSSGVSELLGLLAAQIAEQETRISAIEARGGNGDAGA